MGRRSFAFLFLEPFLGVVAIKTEMGRPSPAKLKTWPDRFNCNGSPVFYASRLVASRKDCLAVRSKKTAHVGSRCARIYLLARSRHPFRHAPLSRKSA